MAGVPAAYHLLILPQDLRTGDPSFAVELYDGYFGLAGAAAPVGSESPFKIMAPSVPWQKELYGFGWLRHLHAAEDQIAREKARKLTLDWVAVSRGAPPIAHDPDTVAKRVIALLSHAAFLLDGADPEFYDATMKLLEPRRSRPDRDLWRRLGRGKAARAHRDPARRALRGRAGNLSHLLPIRVLRGA